MGNENFFDLKLLPVILLCSSEPGHFCIYFVHFNFISYTYKLKTIFKKYMYLKNIYPLVYLNALICMHIL